MEGFCGGIGNIFSTSSPKLFTKQGSRRIVHRDIGFQHGPISRLMSPSGVGELLKPFVFLDAFKSPAGNSFKGFGWHPHSGIATVTLILEGQSWYEETISKGVIPTGGVEYFQAANGAWHQGGPQGKLNPK